MTTEAVEYLGRLDVRFRVDRPYLDLWTILAGIIDNLSLVLGELVYLKAQARIRRIARPLRTNTSRPMVNVEEVHIFLVPLPVIVPHISNTGKPGFGLQVLPLVLQGTRHR